MKGTQGTVGEDVNNSPTRSDQSTKGGDGSEYAGVPGVSPKISFLSPKQKRVAPRSLDLETDEREKCKVCALRRRALAGVTCVPVLDQAVFREPIVLAFCSNGPGASVSQGNLPTRGNSSAFF